MLGLRGQDTLNIPWSDNASAAFTKIKEALDEATVLAYPKPHAPMRIMADATNLAIGAVLQQQIEGSW